MQLVSSSLLCVCVSLRVISTCLFLPCSFLLHPQSGLHTPLSGLRNWGNLLKTLVRILFDAFSLEPWCDCVSVVWRMHVCAVCMCAVCGCVWCMHVCVVRCTHMWCVHVHAVFLCVHAYVCTCGGCMRVPACGVCAVHLHACVKGDKW